MNASTLSCARSVLDPISTIAVELHKRAPQSENFLCFVKKNLRRNGRGGPHNVPQRSTARSLLNRNAVCRRLCIRRHPRLMPMSAIMKEFIVLGLYDAPPRMAASPHTIAPCLCRADEFGFTENELEHRQRRASADVRRRRVDRKMKKNSHCSCSTARSFAADVVNHNASGVMVCFSV